MTLIGWSRRLAIAMFFSLIALPAAAQVPSRAAVDEACKPGSDPQAAGDEAYPGGLSSRASGLTPQHLPGATTVSAREAKCILDRFGSETLVLAAMDGGEMLPNAVEAGVAASADASIQPAFAAALLETVGGDKTRPIVVYCHHERCFLSYNVALRATQAGYPNVFWMRPGLSAWKNAGYQIIAPPPAPGVTEVSAKLRAAIARCHKDFLDYDAGDWASMLTQIPAQSEQDKAFVRDRGKAADIYKICLSNIVRETYSAADKAEAERSLAAADAEVSSVFDAARRDVETNPAKYLVMTWEAHQPARLRADLAALEAVRTIEQACGTIDFSQPPISSSNTGYITGLNQRRMEHAACMERYRSDNGPVNRLFGIESANKWVQATRRFTCAASANKPNCIPNEPFNTIASIASDGNVAKATRQDKLFSDQRSRINGLLDQGNAWIAELNRRIGQYNSGY